MFPGKTKLFVLGIITKLPLTESLFHRAIRVLLHVLKKENWLCQMAQFYASKTDAPVSPHFCCLQGCFYLLGS